jgi:hypothetical protein
MNRKEIIQLRLFHQGLSVNRFQSPDEIVAHFGAVQAQDYSMALWAVGLRMKKPIQRIVESSINSGEIIRTHILRPTWHLVHKNNIRWMMELSAPNVKKATQYVDKKEGLTDELFKKAWLIIERQFKDVENLTKDDIMSCLSSHNITVSNLLATQIIIRAELEMRLCNGEKKGTYALFEKRVPAAAKISKAEATTKLASLYFNSHGPATLKDFAWWSGLSTAEAKIGLAELGSQLEYFTYNDVKYYYVGIEHKIFNYTTSALLPCYDQYTVGYSESREIVLPVNLDSSTIGNGIFKPIILCDNEIVGTWAKSKRPPFVEMQKFSNNKSIPAKKLKESSDKFRSFSALLI